MDNPKHEETYWVYILHCDNNTYYTGYTNDLTKRYRSHLEGTGKCKYTRSFKPLRIAQSWKITGSKSLAMQLERAIKNLPRAKKEILIAQPEEAASLIKEEKKGVKSQIDTLSIYALSENPFLAPSSKARKKSG